MRNYKSEYQNYQGKPDQIKRRSERNKARRLALKKGLLSPGADLDINHKNGSPLDNKLSNLEAISKKANRSYPRNKNARKKNPKD